MERIVNERFAKALAAKGENLSPGDPFSNFVDVVTSFVYEIQSTKGYDFGKMAEGLTPSAIIGETPIIKQAQTRFENFQQQIPAIIQNIKDQLPKEEAKFVDVGRSNKIFKKEHKPRVQLKDYYTNKATEVQKLIEKGTRALDRPFPTLQRGTPNVIPDKFPSKKQVKPPKNLKEHLHRTL